MTAEALGSDLSAFPAVPPTIPAQDVEIAPERPQAADPCPNCGDCFPAGTRGTRKLFCGQVCRKAFHKRMAKRGEVMAAFVLAWRAGRGSSAGAKSAFQEVCAIADEFNAADRAAGRPPIGLYTSNVLQSVGPYNDRQRTRRNGKAIDR